MEQRKLIIILFIACMAVICAVNTAPQISTDWAAQLKPKQSEGLVYRYASSTTKSFPSAGVPVLMYHSVSTVPDDPYCITAAQFEEEMAYLASQGYTALTMEQFYNGLKGSAALPEKPVLITFDDGYADNYDTAWPILARYNLCATFFIITEFRDGNYLSWEQIRILKGEGNDIGSHTLHHEVLSQLSAAEQAAEIRDSKQILEEQLKTEITAFSYPYGKWDDTSLGLLKDAGYTVAFTTNKGKVRAGDDAYQLNRIFVWNGMKLSQFIEKIS